jgi:hypothetical protein
MELPLNGDRFDGTEEEAQGKREEETEKADQPQGKDQAGGEGGGQDALEAPGGVTGERTGTESGHPWEDGEEEVEVEETTKFENKK